MNLCDDEHDEVCFESRNCPVCATVQLLKEAEQEVEDWKEKVESLESEIELLLENK
jgi:hypothetical protein